MYEHLHIAAKDIKVGDEYYSGDRNDPPCYWWHRVTAVDVGQYRVEIETTSFFTYKHPKEGVSVRRWVSDGLTNT